jgi:type III secretory pathway component EscT
MASSQVVVTPYAIFQEKILPKKNPSLNNTNLSIPIKAQPFLFSVLSFGTLVLPEYVTNNSHR